MGGKKFPPHLLSLKKIFTRILLLSVIIFTFISLRSIPAWSSSRATSFLTLKNSAGDVVLSVPVKCGQVFFIRYIHSVAKTPVEDYFKIAEGKLLLDKTVYMDFGAGLPHTLEGKQKMSIKNGQVEISNYNMFFSSFDVRVGRIAQHELVLLPVNETSFGNCPLLDIPLEYFSPPGSAITFIVETRE